MTLMDRPGWASWKGWIKHALSLEMGERNSQEKRRKSGSHMNSKPYICIQKSRGIDTQPVLSDLELKFGLIKVLVLGSAANAILCYNTATLGA